jgi:CubicO group peptidase (beta-lactamase class C family)
MKKILLILYLCAFNISFSQFEKINTFQNKLIENEITGSNVALVWHNGKVIYHNIENSYHTNGKPINENSIFPIWSMSKPITIVAMMILKERGMIDFKDNVSKYLPEFKNLTCKNPDGSIYQCKNSLSIFHLLTHRSGYGYYGNPQFFTSTLKYNNLEDFSKDVASHPVEFEPGSDYLYGINMAILGRIIEVVTKKTFYEFLKEEIFNPFKNEGHQILSDFKRPIKISTFIYK